MVCWSRVERGLRALSCVLAVVFMLLFVYVALKRMHYPFELEKMESGMATSIWRVANHQPLYVRPSMTWASFLYAPLFFYVCAPLTKLVGAGYVAGRLVSTLSTLGVFASIAAFVWLETRRVAPALAAAGLYACLFSTLGAWYDIGRVDSLALLLMMLALMATRFLHPAVAALLWVAVFQTKQGYLPIAPVLFLFEWARPRRMIAGMVAYIAAAAASIAWMQHVSGGWYNFYVFGTTTQLPIVWREVALYVPNDLLRVVGIAGLMIGVAAVFKHRSVAPEGMAYVWRNRRVAFYVLSSAVIVAVVWYVRGHRGASENSLFPAYAWIAVLFGLSVATLDRQFSHLRLRAELGSLLWCAVAVQIGMHLYNPGRWVPWPAMRADRVALLEQMRAMPGDVWAVNHSWDNVLIGKPIHPEMDAFDAVLARPVNDQTRAANQQLWEAWRTGHFAAVLLDDPTSTYLPQTGFDSATFVAHYGLVMRAAGTEEGHVQNQPIFVRVPCGADRLPGDPYATRDAFVDHNLCR